MNWYMTFWCQEKKGNEWPQCDFMNNTSIAIWSRNIWSENWRNLSNDHVHQIESWKGQNISKRCKKEKMRLITNTMDIPVEKKEIGSDQRMMFGMTFDPYPSQNRISFISIFHSNIDHYRCLSLNWNIHRFCNLSLLFFFASLRNILPFSWFYLLNMSIGQIPSIFWPDISWSHCNRSIIHWHSHQIIRSPFFLFNKKYVSIHTKTNGWWQQLN